MKKKRGEARDVEPEVESWVRSARPRSCRHSIILFRSSVMVTPPDTGSWTSMATLPCTVNGPAVVFGKCKLVRLREGMIELLKRLVFICA